MYRLSLPFALIVNDMPLGQLQSVIKSSKETDVECNLIGYRLNSVCIQQL